MPENLIDYGLVGVLLTALGKFVYTIYTDQKVSIAKYQTRADETVDKVMTYLDAKSESDAKMVDTMDCIHRKICDIDVRLLSIEEERADR